MKSISVLIVVILSVLLLTNIAWAEQCIIVNLKLLGCPWAGSRLSEKLDRHLSTIERVPIIRPDVNLDSPTWPPEPHSLDKLVDRGKLLDGRFLVDILIDRIDLEKRKTTFLPYLLCRYRVFCVLKGSIRIVDIEKARLYKFKEIDYDLRASNSWQFYDIDENDSGLRIPADRKVVLFDRLEEIVASELFNEIKQLTEGNSFAGKKKGK